MNVEKNGVSYLQKGNGEDLVFLHGYLSSKEAFLPLIEYFSKYYRVTAFDFCGFGQSSPLPYPFSVEDYAAWAQEALRLLHVTTPYCVAHSFGCRVAVKMHALSQNEEGRCEDTAVFQRAVFTGPAGIMPKRTLSYRAKVKAYRAVKRFFPNFAARRFGSEEYKTLPPVMKESYKKIVNEDLRAEIARFPYETLVIEGRDDVVIPAKEAEEYAALLPRGKLRYIYGGHFAFLQDAAAFITETEEFFAHG